VAALGVLVFGLATAGKGLRIVPSWFAIVGLVITAVTALSMLTVVTKAGTPFIPIGRFTSLIWLLVLGFLVPRGRRA
jgi:hypothetical protein